jgi:cytosine/creatinine deaminase
VFAEARERWRGRIDLQGSPLFSIELALDAAHMADVEAMLDAHGSGILGAATRMVPELHQGLGVLFDLAERKGWELDFHVDESSDPAARALKVVADMAIERGFARRILVGHCCSLALQGDDERRKTIDAVARAGLSVVSLPMCNMFLQDREGGRTPRWRGVTALHELKRAGANVMIASDNTRDPFYPYGDLDMMEVWREGVRILHLDYPFADWAPAVSAAPAKAMGLELGVLRSGMRADMILTSARDFTELLARPQSDRVVVRNGEASSAAAPDYAELDALQGLAP